MKWAAMLRGVNLGGRKLIMAEFKALVEAMGYRDVQTLLASGNVVFSAEGTRAEIESALEAALLAHGLKTDVMIRDHAELTAVIAANPFPEAAADHPSHMLVTFHRDPFPEDCLERLAAIHDGPERLQANARELYVDYGGQQQMRDSTLLQASNKAKFPKIATGRNWNTVRKLAEMTAGEP